MKRNKLLTLLAAAAMMLGVQSANAQSVRLTALRGSNYGAGEGPAKLVDGTQNTKWGTWDGYYGNPVYVVLKADKPIAPTTYELVIANDTNGDPGRNWQKWKIYAGNFASEAEATYNASGWVEIDSKDENLTTGQFAVAPFSLSNPQTSYYSYFKIVVEGLASGNWNKYCQMDEFRFKDYTIDPNEAKLTCTAGTDFGGENGIDKMFDGNFGTKFAGATGDNCYALLTASEPVFVWGYDVTTAGGSALGQRQIYGTNDATVGADPSADGWVLLSDFNEWIQSDVNNRQRFLCDKSKIAPYKYFKVVLKSGGDVQLSEFALLYENKRVINYNWKESSNNNSASAFDGKPNPKWEGGNSNLKGHWFTIETADQKSHPVKSYSFTTNDDGSYGDRAPKEWRLEGSNDNSAWVTIDEVTGGNPIDNKNFKTYEFIPANSTDAFRYVKLTLINMKGTGWSQVGEFHVLSVADVSDKAYYTGLVNDAKAAAADYEAALGATDPWYAEYKPLVDELDGILASSISVGNYVPVQEKLDEIKVFTDLMTQFIDGANFIALDGNNSYWGDGHWRQLVDGNNNTKWGGNFPNTGEHVMWMIFRAKASIKPYFYKLLTGWDTQQYPSRNWSDWKIYGGNFTTKDAAQRGATGWTEIDTRTGVGQDLLPAKNGHLAPFGVNGTFTDEYYYFMVEVTKAYNNGSQIQMNELVLGTEAEFNQTKADYLAELNAYVVPDIASAQQKQEYADAVTAVQNANPENILAMYNAAKAKQSEIFTSLKDGDFYQITSPTDFELFSDLVNTGGEPAAKVKLTQDLDLNGFKFTEILGFAGEFNGQGKTIKNMGINDPAGWRSGLFASANGATIADVVFENADVFARNSASIAVGEATNCTIKNIMVKNSSITTASGDRTGAIAGQASGGTIQNCAVVNTTIKGWNYVGAITGNAIDGATIKNCYSDSDVKAQGSYAGGVAGAAQTATIEKNLFKGTVTSEYDYAAGLVGLFNVQTDKNYTLVLQKNMVAATSVTAPSTKTMIVVPAFPTSQTTAPTYSGNYILDSTVYSDGTKAVSNPDDENGKQISLSEATDYDFYATSAGLGWDMTNDWQYVARFVFPVLAWMEAVVPVEDIAVTSAGYATYFTKAELDFSSLKPTVQAFVPQVGGSGSNMYVHLEPITYVPAGLGIVIKAPAGTYNVPYSQILAKDVPSDLKEAPAGFNATGSQYILAEYSGVVGFYQADPGTTITEGKGYIEITGAPVKALFFLEDDATAIQTIDNGQQTTDAPIYNVAGQRMSKAQKGINIVNGKKVLR